MCVCVVSDPEKQSLRFKRRMGLVLKSRDEFTAGAGKMKEMITLFNGQLGSFGILYVWFEENSCIIPRSIMILSLDVLNKHVVIYLQY